MTGGSPEEYNLRQRAQGKIDVYAWNWLVSRGVRSLQEEAGIVVDGKCGPRTQHALALALSSISTDAPIPETRAQMLQTYGNFKYALRYKTLEDGRKKYCGVKIDPAWVRANIVKVRLHTGQVRRMHRLVAEEFATLFEEACIVSGYTPRSVQ